MENQATEKDFNHFLEQFKILEDAITQIQTRLDKLEQTLSLKEEVTPQTNQHVIHEIDFMNLPDSLRKTMIMIAELKEATPEEVALKTNRTRGLENIYLNQLERMSYVEKVKRGKRVYFRSLRIL